MLVVVVVVVVVVMMIIIMMMVVDDNDNHYVIVKVKYHQLLILIPVTIATIWMSMILSKNNSGSAYMVHNSFLDNGCDWLVSVVMESTHLANLAGEIKQTHIIRLFRYYTHHLLVKYSQPISTIYYINHFS